MLKELLWCGSPLVPARSSNRAQHVSYAAHSSFTRLQGLQIKGAASVAPAEAQMNVIVLAGGFNEQLVEQIVKKAAEDTLGKDSSTTMLRKTPVNTLVNSGRLAIT
jgi:hypothetical protein